MKRLLKWFGYVVMISQLFSIQIPILSTIVAGYSVKYILYYLFIGIVNVLWWVKMLRRGRIRLRDFAVGMMIVGPFVVGILLGWSPSDIFVEAVLLIMPLAVYQWVELVDIRPREFIIVFGLTCIAAGVVSVLVALRIVQTNIWAAADDFVRSAGAIDSTLGVGGVAIALVLLYVYPDGCKGKYRLLLMGMLVSSAVTLLFSQSRMRIVLVILLVIGVICYNFFNRRSELGTLRLMAMIGIALAAAVMLFPQVFSQILDQVAARFASTSGSDVNVTFRSDESTLQLRGFLSSPLVGLGWGCRSQYQNMYVHNMYTALLMHGGLLFGGMYIVWFLSYLYEAIRRVLRGQGVQMAMISGCLMLALAVLTFTNGGIAQSGGYFMMVFLFVDDKLRKEKRERLIPKR